VIVVAPPSATAGVLLSVGRSGPRASPRVSEPCPGESPPLGAVLHGFGILLQAPFEFSHTWADRITSDVRLMSEGGA